MLYDTYTYCSAVGEDAAYGRIVYFDKIITSIGELCDWQVKQSIYPNIFEIHHSIDTTDKEQITYHYNDVNDILLWLSYRNQLGFIPDFRPNERREGQTITVKMGLAERMLHGLRSEDLDLMKKACIDEVCKDALWSLREFYSQFNFASKLLIGWAALERIFGASEGMSIFSGDQLKELEQKILELNWMNKDSIKKVMSALKSHFLHRQGRNERMAIEIARATHEDHLEVLKKVSRLSEIRGEASHTLNLRSKSFLDHANFIEDTLRTFIENRVTT